MWSNTQDGVVSTDPGRERIIRCCGSSRGTTDRSHTSLENELGIGWLHAMDWLLTEHAGSSRLSRCFVQRDNSKAQTTEASSAARPCVRRNSSNSAYKKQMKILRAITIMMNQPAEEARIEANIRTKFSFSLFFFPLPDKLSLNDSWEEIVEAKQWETSKRKKQKEQLGCSTWSAWMRRCSPRGHGLSDARRRDDGNGSLLPFPLRNEEHGREKSDTPGSSSPAARPSCSRNQGMECTRQ